MNANPTGYDSDLTKCECGYPTGNKGRSNIAVRPDKDVDPTEYRCGFDRMYMQIRPDMNEDPTG